MAILYRTNAQSAQFEAALSKAGANAAEAGDRAESAAELRI